MARGRFSDSRVHGWLAELATCYVSLHFDNPDTAGAYASEVFGGSYVRCKTTFSIPSNRATWNTSLISFTGLPACTLTHMGIWDAAYNGNFWGGFELDPNIRCLPGSRFDRGLQQFALSFA